MLFDQQNSLFPQTKIKLCGVKDVDIALFAIMMNIDAIGFIFYSQSPRYILLEQAREISDRVAGKIDVIGVFVNAKKEEVNHVLQNVRLTGLQFHGNETMDFCSQWELPWIKAIPVAQQHTPDDIKKTVRYWSQKAFLCLLDTKAFGLYGGTGQRFDWSCISPEISSSIVLSGGVKEENIMEAMTHIRPHAIDINSGVEISPGIKSKELIKQIMQKIHSKE